MSADPPDYMGSRSGALAVLGSRVGYLDKEEGKDCVEKTWITTKLATAVGLVGSAVHIAAFQPDCNSGCTEKCLPFLPRRLVRHPDDPLNYFFGSCASGIFLGVRTHSYMTGTTACLGLGVLAALTKVGKKEGWRISGAPRL
ncbi:NADH dehydrogenase [ubiquinone] 1 alpha subcomplex subunit 11-like [Polyodon spathula]|uniref:NADH dehydrogenase [ubiquinone] 1 alpha subcomplex subunit 11-like n=1 Tax=Polyodon spathula TaxID=7913 RepID=UPI001B7DBAC6|nr:NADH dehydrogenase [ubiquinone] 1 alpha subcomplex subunit 11-like [Polyodon spathula]